MQLLKEDYFEVYEIASAKDLKGDSAKVEEQ